MDDNQMTSLVLARGLIQPGIDMSEEILSNDALLGELAGVWRGHKEAIETLIKARIYPIQHDLVFNATPAEVIILREAIIQVATIGDDLERYAVEFEKREKERKARGDTGEMPAPTIEDNPSGQDTGTGASSM